jgi:hypothetical protein
MHKTQILKIGAFVGVFLFGFILGKMYTPNSDFSTNQVSSPEAFFLARSQEKVPLERALLETLLENKKETVAAFQMVFTTAFPKNREVVLLAEKELAQSKKDVELLESWLYEWYGVQVKNDEEALPVEVPAPL